MKKAILSSVLVAAAALSMEAGAATACTGGSAATVSISAGTNFIKTGFAARCSNNTHVTYDDQATYIKVGGTSVKGKNAFGASSAGGGIVGSGCASATGCVSGDAETAMSAAPSS